MRRINKFVSGKIIDRGLLILLIINLILYLPSLFEPISYGDECIYLTLGNAFRRGLVFYRDIHDNKPPLLYLVAALTNGRLFWFRLITIAWNLIHLAVIYELIKKLTRNKFAPLIGGAVFSLLLLILEGRIANGEVFMMMPATLAVYLLFRYPKKKSLLFGLLIGFLFALGFLFKVPVGFDFIGILLALYLFPLKSIKIKEILAALREKRFLGMIAGFTLPIFLTIIYYAAKGAFTPYVRSALLQNIGYLSSWEGSNWGLAIRFLLLAVASLLLFLFRRKAPSISGRPYPHYLIEVIPSFAVLSALASEKKDQLRLCFIAMAVISLSFSWVHFRFWWYPIIPYYQNFISYIKNSVSQEEYLSFWGEKTKNDYLLSRFIQDHTNREERVFLWGDGACIYAISRRLPPGRYTVNYHIFDFNGFEGTLSAIKRHRPKIIIKLQGENRVWPELDQVLEKDYRRIFLRKILDQIYVRR